MSNKQKTSFTLSEEARHLLVDLAAATGISQTAMLEVLIRAAAVPANTPFVYQITSGFLSAGAVPQEKVK